MGTFKTAIENLLGYNKTTFLANKFLNANNVVFSSYGSDIHVSDIVKTAIHRVCEEVSKCSIKSVVEYRNPHRIEVQNDSINAVLSSRVNPFCGAKDFLYKIAYLLLVNKNCFIYWQYDEVPIEGTKYVKRITRGFYPIEKANIKIYSLNGEIRAELSSLGNGISLDMPYNDLIHIRLGYGANPYMGGNSSGTRDNRELLENLTTLHVIKEAIPKSLEASLSLKGILSMKTVADVDKKHVTPKYGGTVYDTGAKTTTGYTYNNDYSTNNKTQNVTVVIQNYAQEVDVDNLVREINIKLAEQM